MGVNADNLCVITSNITAWRASYVTIIGIWNDALVFILGAGTLGSSSIIIGFWGVCVGVGVWSNSTVCSSSTTAGKVSACVGFRRGERRLWHCFSVYLIFIFLHGWEYHVSAAVYLGRCTPYGLGWAPSEVRCSPSEVFFIWFWSGAGMGTGVLYSVIRWWLCGVARSALSCVGFVEVWDWGSVLTENVFSVSLNVLLIILVLGCDVLDDFSLGSIILWLPQRCL